MYVFCVLPERFVDEVHYKWLGQMVKMISHLISRWIDIVKAVQTAIRIVSMKSIRYHAG